MIVFAVLVLTVETGEDRNGNLISQVPSCIEGTVELAVNCHYDPDPVADPGTTAYQAPTLTHPTCGAIAPFNTYRSPPVTIL
jgi:hypothetical protein